MIKKQETKEKQLSLQVCINQGVCKTEAFGLKDKAQAQGVIVWFNKCNLSKTWV